MTVLEIVIVGYLSVGFAKFVLDISRLPFFYELITCVESKLAEDWEPGSGFRAKLLLGVTVGLSIQSWLAWPQVLYGEGILAFLQPISKHRAGEIVGQPFGLAFEFNDD
jgi:hypothetical protein